MKQRQKQKRIVFRVLPLKGAAGWKVTRSTGSPRTRVFRRAEGFTKSDAVASGRLEAKGRGPSQLVVHKRDGKIEFEHTYGSDPRRTKG